MTRRSTRPNTLAGRYAGQDLDALRHGRDGVEVELPLGDGARNVLAEHQVLEVRAREHDALHAGEPARAAQLEEALDLRAHAADRLDLAELVDAAGDRDALVDGDVGEGGEHAEELGGRGAVAVDLAVALLERDLRLDAEGPFLSEDPREVAADDGNALGVNGAAELRLVLDVDEALAAQRHHRGDAHRLSELHIACRIHG